MYMLVFCEKAWNHASTETIDCSRSLGLLKSIHLTSSVEEGVFNQYLLGDPAQSSPAFQNPGTSSPNIPYTRRRYIQHSSCCSETPLNTDQANE